MLNVAGPDGCRSWGTARIAGPLTTATIPSPPDSADRARNARFPLRCYSEDADTYARSCGSRSIRNDAAAVNPWGEQQTH